MGTKIKNKIIDDFNKSYDCKLTAEDIITKTDYFNTSPQTSQKVNPLFKVRYSYAFMYVLIIFLSLSVCGLFGYNQYIKRGDYCDQTVEVEPTLTDEDFQYISKYVNKNNIVECFNITLNYTNTFTIFRSISNDDFNEVVYFYKANNLNNDSFEYKLIYNNESISINNNKNIGILCIFEQNVYEKKYIEFSLNIDNTLYDYIFAISNISIRD